MKEHFRRINGFPLLSVGMSEALLVDVITNALAFLCAENVVSVEAKIHFTNVKKNWAENFCIPENYNYTSCFLFFY